MTLHDKSTSAPHIYTPPRYDDLYEAERAENESQKQKQIEDVRRKVKITLAAIWVWLVASLLMIFLTITTC